jgi:hypothetical protein
MPANSGRGAQKYPVEQGGLPFGSVPGVAVV